MAIEQHPSFFPQQLFETAPALDEFTQPTLLEVDKPEEVLLENCLVTNRPIYKKQGNIHEWRCSMYAPADIFHQDRDELVEVYTTTYAETAQSKHVKPGDRVNLKGIVQQQEMELGNGEKKIVNHLLVSDMQVIGRARRVSITVFEQKQRR